MTAGRIRIKVFGANELVPAFEAFDAVSRARLKWAMVRRIIGKVRTKQRSFFLPFLLV